MYSKAEILSLARFQDGDTKVKFMLKILEKIHLGSEIGSGSRSGFVFGSEKVLKAKSQIRIRKTISDQQNCAEVKH